MTDMKVKPLVLLLGLVLLMHWSSLSWLSDQIRGPSSLKLMTEPMFTRVIEQAAVVKPIIAPLPKAAATSPPAKKSKAQPQTVPKATPAPAPAEPPAPDPPTAEPTVEIAATPAPPAPEPAQAPTEPAQDTWPPDTRLTYRLTGNYRGELTGSARVQWQQVLAPEGTTEPRRYQVHLEMSLTSIVIASMTSQGKITETGLLPEVYEEKLPGNVRRVTFERNQIRFNNGRVDVQPTTVQDTASQFVELSHRFATGAETLQAGSEVRVWLARPGGLDFWTYDVMAPEILQTPTLGPIEAFHLKPRPLANPRGPIVAEMWFAPGLQYLPVRVRIAMGGGSFVDLMVERIEQSERPKVNAPKENQSRDPT
jgi:Protein of unknown function (DUF3108)